MVRFCAPSRPLHPYLGSPSVWAATSHVVVHMNPHRTPVATISVMIPTRKDGTGEIDADDRKI